MKELEHKLSMEQTTISYIHQKFVDQDIIRSPGGKRNVDPR